MARVCLYNSAMVLDTRGNAINHALVNTPGAPRRSKPLRLFTAQGELRYVSLEFVYYANYSSFLDLRFWLEYFGDVPSLNLPPNLRAAVGFPPQLMWGREVNEIVGAGGVITHETVTRTLVLPADTGLIGTVRWVPLLVHAPWMRLAVYVNGPIPGTGGDDLDVPNAQLAIFAHVGGHQEEKYLEDNGDVPYDYTASA
jgi:hypothetical protein